MQLLQGIEFNQITKMQSFNFFTTSLQAFALTVSFKEMNTATLRHAPNWQVNLILREYCKV